MRSLSKPTLPRRGREFASRQIAISLFVGALVMAALPEDVGAAEAEAAPKKEPVAQVAAAQALFEQGRALLQQNRAGEACPKFEESQRLDPGLGTQFNLADCYERLGKLASAHALFTEVAEAARATRQERREQVARARADAVRPRLSKLVIVVPSGPSAELRVEHDGAEVDSAEWGSPVPVDPGVHRVRAWGPSVGDWATEVTVPAGGGVHRVTIPVSDERGFFAPLHKKLGLAAAGVGVVGVAVGSIFGVRAIVKKNAANEAGCDGPVCNDEGGELREQARSAGNVATVAMSIGAVGLATSAVLFWVVSEPGLERETPESPESNVARLELLPMVGPRGGGLSLRGGF